MRQSVFPGFREAVVQPKVRLLMVAAGRLDASPFVFHPTVGAMTDAAIRCGWLEYRGAADGSGIQVGVTALGEAVAVGLDRLVQTSPDNWRDVEGLAFPLGLAA